MSASNLDRLFVLWREPTDDGTRHVVGMLERREKRFVFRYESKDALPLSRGFRAFVELPSLEESYESGYLFSMFQQRVPHPSRPDRARMMDSWGVTNPDDVMEVLARSGGVQLTDRVELAEWRAADDDLARPLELRLAGIRHHISDHVKVGDTLTLAAEPENAADAHAVRVMDAEDRKVGYVPRQYSALLSKILRAAPGSVHAVVLRRLPDPDCIAGRCVLRVSRRAASAAGLASLG
jgi:HIRAN domain